MNIHKDTSEISAPALHNMYMVDVLYLLLFVLTPMALLLGCTPRLFAAPSFDTQRFGRH